MMVKQRLCCLVLFVSAVIFVFPAKTMAETRKPATTTELALYTGLDRQKLLEDGAQKEGNLLFYTSGTEGWVPDLISRFVKKYPYIKVEKWQTTGNTLTSRILEEYQAGRHVVDIQNHGQRNQVVAEEIGIIQPFNSPSLEAINDQAVRRAPGGGAWGAAYYEIGYGLGYNTRLVSSVAVPKSPRDLLNSKWKGQMAIGAERGIDWMGNMLVAYGEDFVRQLAKQELQIHSINSLALLSLISNGEYPFTPAAADAHVLILKKKGAALDWVPLEPVLMSTSMICLSKYPPHPHAALLFIDFILSNEAVEKVFKANNFGSTRKADQKTYKKFYGAKSSKEVMEWNKLYKELFLTAR